MSYELFLGMLRALLPKGLVLKTRFSANMPGYHRWTGARDVQYMQHTA